MDKLKLKGRTLICTILLIINILPLSAQKTGIKTNVLYLATTTLNAGLDFKFSEHWSGSIMAGYNPWQFPGAKAQWSTGEVTSANRKALHILVMPEVKWWPHKTFDRHSFGLHTIYSAYNISGLPYPKALQNARYTGNLYGLGISWGYQWSIGKRWGIEFALGAGYLWTCYNKYEAGACGEPQEKGHRGFIAPTKLALNIVYYLN